MGIGLLALTALGIDYQDRWSWLVIPAWTTAVATLGLFVGAVITAIYAQKMFAGQAEKLREERTSNSRQIDFNNKQLEILQTQAHSGIRSTPADPSV